MKESTRKWVNAGIAIGKDKTAVVACPQCDEGILLVKDEPIKERPGKAERWMICNKCGAWNTILGVDV